MKVVTASIVLSISFLVTGRPQVLQETKSEALEALSRPFEVFKDYQKLNIPHIESPRERTSNTHPYDFVLKNDGSGNYYFSFDNYNGFRRHEIGELKNAGTDNEVLSVRGQYLDTYIPKEGNVAIVRTIGYTADENGFRPFLIDISTEPYPFPSGLGGGAPPLVGGTAPVGGPKGQKTDISSTVLGTLIGGNLG